MSERVLAKTPWCNRDPATAPRVLGHRAPLCWRCIGIVSGAAAGVAISVQASLYVAAALAMPCIIHGTARYAFGTPVTNAGRLATGLLMGVAIAVVDWQVSAIGF